MAVKQRVGVLKLILSLTFAETCRDLTETVYTFQCNRLLFKDHLIQFDPWSPGRIVSSFFGHFKNDTLLDSIQISHHFPGGDRFRINQNLFLVE